MPNHCIDKPERNRENVTCNVSSTMFVYKSRFPMRPNVYPPHSLPINLVFYEHNFIRDSLLPLSFCYGLTTGVTSLVSD